MRTLASITLLFMSLTLGAAEKAAPNVILLCIDDLRPELASFGANYIHSPNIDSLASTGRAFQRHYVQAPTCGASRYTLLTGRYGPAGNNALFQRAARLRNDPASIHPSLPAWFRQHGYTTVSVGKVSHHPGGLGGPDWNDPAQVEMPLSWDRNLMPSGPWKHPRGAMHGLAEGEIRISRPEMDVFQAFDGPDTSYPDGLITDEALKQLEELAAGPSTKPFFLAVGIIRPHLPFGAPSKYLDHYRDVDLPPIPHPDRPPGKTTWHRSGEFMGYHRWDRDPNDDPELAEQARKHYAACVSYADAQVGRILEKLSELNLSDRTVIVLWGDHGWHLGEHAIWGKHALFEESLRSPLIIRYPEMPSPGEPSASIVETIDLFPTLCDLAGLSKPEFLQGGSLLPILKNPKSPGHPAYSYTGNARTIRTEEHRLIQHRDGHIELYDNTSDEGETRNRTDEHQDVAKRLKDELGNRLGKWE